MFSLTLGIAKTLYRTLLTDHRSSQKNRSPQFGPAMGEGLFQLDNWLPKTQEETRRQVEVVGFMDFSLQGNW
jgi:hypothetical protein